MVIERGDVRGMRLLRGSTPTACHTESGAGDGQAAQRRVGVPRPIALLQGWPRTPDRRRICDARAADVDRRRREPAAGRPLGAVRAGGRRRVRSCACCSSAPRGIPAALRRRAGTTGTRSRSASRAVVSRRRCARAWRGRSSGSALIRAFDAIYGVSSGGLIAAYAAGGRMERRDRAAAAAPARATSSTCGARCGAGPCCRSTTSSGSSRAPARRRLRRRRRPTCGCSPPASTTGACTRCATSPDSTSCCCALRACCAIPVISRETVTLRGHELADGGLIESVPFRTPLAEGTTHVLALRSRDAGLSQGPPRARLRPRRGPRHQPPAGPRCRSMIRARPALLRRRRRRARARRSAGEGAARRDGAASSRPAAGTPLVGRLETDAEKVARRDARRARVGDALDALSARRP